MVRAYARVWPWVTTRSILEEEAAFGAQRERVVAFEREWFGYRHLS